jgi:hypothetical protein
MKKIFLLILFSLFVGVAGAQVKDTLRVLAIGNSFSEDAVEQYLWELGQETGVEFVIGNAYRGGWSLMSHWKDARSLAADTEFRKVTEGKRVNHGKHTLREIITDEPWDVITFQQVSQEAGRIESYEPGLSLMIGYVKGLARVDSVRLGFHQTWAYAKDSDHKGFNKYNRNQFLMYSCITAAVDKAMHYHQGDLTFYIPSGTAIQNARTTLLAKSRPNEPVVNRELTRDGYHLNYTVGRYIAACTWFEVLTGKSCVGLKSRPKGVIPELALIAQQAAHAAVLSPMTVTPVN